MDPMPSPAAINLRPCIGFIPSSSNSSKPSFFCRVSPTVTAGPSICRCSVEDATTPQRAWAVFKEIRSGSRLAWFHTASGYGSVSPAKGVERDSGEDDDGNGRENGVNVSEEVVTPSVKLQRRARSERDASVNPDLLTIPGIGPRNLRKLVQKGIGGVAQLKQLYRDKVYIIKCVA